MVSTQEEGLPAGGTAMQSMALAYLRDAALAAARAGRAGQAESYLQRALALDSADPDLWVLMGAISSSQDVRAACARRALAVAPDHPRAQALLAGGEVPLGTPDNGGEGGAIAATANGAPAPFPWAASPPALDPAFRPAAPRLTPVGAGVRRRLPWAGLSLPQAAPRRAPAAPPPLAASPAIPLTRAPAPRPAWTPRSRLRLAAAAALLLVVLANLLLARAFERRYSGRIVPGVRVAGLAVGGLTPAEAESWLEQLVGPALRRPLRLTYAAREWIFSAGAIGLRYRTAEAVAAAQQVGHRPRAWLSWQERLSAGLWGANVDLEVATVDAQLEAVLDQVAAAVDRPAVPPAVTWGDGGWVLSAGQDGRHVLRDELRSFLMDRLAGLSYGDAASAGEPLVVAVPVITDSAALSDSTVEHLRQQLVWAGRPLTLTCADRAWLLEAIDIAAWLRVTLAPPGVQVDRAALQSYLETLEPAVAIPVQRGRLEVQGGRATVFQAARDGRGLERDLARVALESALNRRLRGEVVEQVDLPTRVVPAGEDALIAEYGVGELIGQGRSSYTGSSWERVTNIVVGGGDLNGWLVAPGEVFSLNGALDPVTWEKGYVMSEIITGGQVGWGLGGGLCQVATTLYRAALNTGLEIVERQPHQWRLAWYEQDSPPGFDATIMIGSTDLKFRNTTGHYILIQVETDAEASKQVVNIYGTSPGWQVTIGDVFDGGYSVSFRRTVIDADGQVILDETVYSGYQ